MVNLHPTLNTLCQVIPTKWRTYHDHRICDVLVVRTPGPIDANSIGQWWRLPQEKTPCRAPPCEELDPPYDIKLFCAENYTCS